MKESGKSEKRNFARAFFKEGHDALCPTLILLGYHSHHKPEACQSLTSIASVPLVEASKPFQSKIICCKLKSGIPKVLSDK